jgi:predicted dehydrogenase
MSILKIGVIGAGMAFTPHARALRDLQDRIAVARVMSRSTERAEEVRSRFGFATTPSIEEVLGDPAIDAVIILTPPASHLELVRQMAGAGKHILLEKPLSVSSTQAREIVEICARRQVRLGVVLQHRFREPAQQLRKLIAQGALGSIEAVFATIPWWRPQSYYDEPGRGTLVRDGGGVLLTQGIHTIDLLQFLAGPVEEVFACATTSRIHTMETEDLVTATLRFSNGALGSLSATTACYPGYSEQIRIIGSRGSACLEGEALQVQCIDGAAIVSGAPAVLGGGADPMAFSHASHRALIAQFVECIQKGSDPIPGGREGLQVQLLIDALLQSAREQRVVRVEQVR